MLVQLDINWSQLPPKDQQSKQNGIFDSLRSKKKRMNLVLEKDEKNQRNRSISFYRGDLHTFIPVVVWSLVSDVYHQIIEDIRWLKKLNLHFWCKKHCKSTVDHEWDVQKRNKEWKYPVSNGLLTNVISIFLTFDDRIESIIFVTKIIQISNYRMTVERMPLSKK